MGGIIWIASYPKSGNTWMRAFLANYVLDRCEPLGINELGAFTLSDTRPRFYQEAAGRPIADITETESVGLRTRAQELIAATRPHDHFVKTHSLNVAHYGIDLINPLVTKGAICITRNPLDLVTSYAAHFNLSIDAAINAMADPTNSSISTKHRVFTLLGRWDDHVRSWRETDAFPLILVRYEDLLSKPAPTFKHIVENLGLPLDGDRLDRAIRFSSFKELSEQERRDGFSERPPHNERFFRKGKSGAWRNDLTRTQIERLTNAHRGVMGSLGYL
ncbi:MAG: sulfotransferase domain-containing protein [Alphaproteobacteria bacterium]|nr:sulfotransferase domain-containing protein [Alphaproteobacteria bacterium]